MASPFTPETQAWMRNYAYKFIRPKPFDKNWTDRLKAWFNADRERGFSAVRPGEAAAGISAQAKNFFAAMARPNTRLGGEFYVLSNGLTIFAETLSQWGK